MTKEVKSIDLPVEILDVDFDRREILIAIFDEDPMWVKLADSKHRILDDAEGIIGTWQTKVADAVSEHGQNDTWRKIRDAALGVYRVQRERQKAVYDQWTKYLEMIDKCNRTYWGDDE